MSYCFNPGCDYSENPSDGRFCQNCGSKLVLSQPDSTSERPVYRAIKLIGQGGFGRTFLAVDESQPLLPRCVIKQFFPQGTNAQKASELFHQEAQQLERLGKHPQIPAWLGYFEQDGHQYLVQEYIAGKTLAQELLQRGAFNQDEVQKILQDLLPVLDFIHQHKIIHRDIKPENIIRRRQTSGKGGNLVLVDFGAAKLVTDKMMPKTGTVIGSAAYTAPEQLMGKAVFASDLYSLGVTCIHLLTEVYPFDLFDSREGTWVWRDYLKTSVSDELGNILDKMLQGATNRRYHSAAAILRQLMPRSEYRRAFPELKIQAEHQLDCGLEKTYKSYNNFENIKDKNKFKTPKKSIIIQKKLQNALNLYPVKIKVSWINKNQLTVVISRPEESPINYSRVARIIGLELTQLQLKGVRRVKVLGRVQNQSIPEWKKQLVLDQKIKLKNQLINLQKHSLYLQILTVTTPQYWLSKFRHKEFWLDVFMSLMIGFIFSQNIILISPLMAIGIAAAFLQVKHQIEQTSQVAVSILFGTITMLFILFGWLDLKLGSQGLFGIILAGLFIALPVFYSKGN